MSDPRKSSPQPKRLWLVILPIAAAAFGAVSLVLRAERLGASPLVSVGVVIGGLAALLLLVWGLAAALVSSRVRYVARTYPHALVVPLSAPSQLVLESRALAAALGDPAVEMTNATPTIALDAEGIHVVGAPPDRSA